MRLILSKEASMASLFLVYAAIIVAWSFLAAVLSWKRTDIFAASAGGTKRRPLRVRARRPPSTSSFWKISGQQRDGCLRYRRAGQHRHAPGNCERALQRVLRIARRRGIVRKSHFTVWNNVASDPCSVPTGSPAALRKSRLYGQLYASLPELEFQVPARLWLARRGQPAGRRLPG